MKKNKLGDQYDAAESWLPAGMRANVVIEDIALDENYFDLAKRMRKEKI